MKEKAKIHDRIGAIRRRLETLQDANRLNDDDEAGMGWIADPYEEMDPTFLASLEWVLQYFETHQQEYGGYPLAKPPVFELRNLPSVADKSWWLVRALERRDRIVTTFQATEFASAIRGIPTTLTLTPVVDAGINRFKMTIEDRLHPLGMRYNAGHIEFDLRDPQTLFVSQIQSEISIVHGEFHRAWNAAVSRQGGRAGTQRRPDNLLDLQKFNKQILSRAHRVASRIRVEVQGDRQRVGGYQDHNSPGIEEYMIAYTRHLLITHGLLSEQGDIVILHPEETYWGSSDYVRDEVVIKTYKQGVAKSDVTETSDIVALLQKKFPEEKITDVGDKMYRLALRVSDDDIVIWNGCVIPAKVFLLQVFKSRIPLDIAKAYDEKEMVANQSFIQTLRSLVSHTYEYRHLFAPYTTAFSDLPERSSPYSPYARVIAGPLINTLPFT